MENVKMDLPKEVQELFEDEAPKIPAIKVDYYIFYEDAGWVAVCPAMHGLKVSGLASCAAARNAISAAIGKIGSAAGRQHKPMPWKEVDFTPPEGAIHRAFVVGQIQPQEG